MHLDEPFADTSIGSTYQISRASRKDVKVVLSGDGADEILAGYPTYIANDYYKTYSKFPSKVQAAAEGIARMLPRSKNKKLGLDYKLIQFLSARGRTPRMAHYWWRNLFCDEEKQSIFSVKSLNLLSDFDPFDAFNDCFEEVKTLNFTDNCFYFDTKPWL